MAETTIQILSYYRRGAVVDLDWSRDGLVYKRSVTATKIDTLEKLAAWIMAQPVGAPNNNALSVQLTVTTDAEGQITGVTRNQRIENLLNLIDARRAQITSDLALLPTATTAQLREILGRLLNAEDKEIEVVGGLLRVVRRLDQ